MDKKVEASLLKEINELEPPIAPEQIKWDEPCSILVECTRKPDFDNNQFEHVIIDNEERTLWTTPSGLNRELRNAEINAGDTIGIKYHGEEKTSNNFMVKIFTVKNFGIIKA